MGMCCGKKQVLKDSQQELLVVKKNFEEISPAAKRASQSQVDLLVNEVMHSKHHQGQFQRFLDKGKQRSEEFQHHDKQHKWGTEPFHYYIENVAQFEKLCEDEYTLQHSLSIVEPWPDVGRHHKLDEGVRASLNVAYIAQAAASMNSVCYATWETGTDVDYRRIVANLTKSAGSVFEGGGPDVHDESTFTKKTPRSYLFDLIKAVLLQSEQFRGPCIFICLSHQMVLTCVTELVIKAVQDCLDDAKLDELDDAQLRKELKQAAQDIHSGGNNVFIHKGLPHEKLRIVAKGYQDQCFSTYKNEQVEHAKLTLYEFKMPHNTTSGLTEEMVRRYNDYSKSKIGVVEELVINLPSIEIAMFHGVEVNYEAVVFDTWALQLLDRIISPRSEQLAASPSLKWLLDLPVGVEIIAMTRDKDSDQVITEVANSRIDFRRGHSFYTCQYHPELQADLRSYDRAVSPDYQSLQQEDGANLLVSMLASRYPGQ